MMLFDKYESDEKYIRAQAEIPVDFNEAIKPFLKSKKKMKELDVKKAIKHYQTLLTCEQFVITGSYVLAKQKLKNFQEVGDLDIILINPTEEARNILARLQKDSPAKTRGSGGTFIFMHGDIKIDVFIEKIPYSGLLTDDGVLMNSVGNIIRAKKNINRIKDWVQLRNIARQFFRQDEFENFLNTYNHKEIF